MSRGGGKQVMFQWQPEKVVPAAVILCERAGTWATALRCESEVAEIRLHETRSIRECWNLLKRAAGGFIVAELSQATVEQLLDRTSRLNREYPLARLAVVADRTLAGYEEAFREAGAVAFITSSRDLRPLAAAIRLHLQQIPPPQRNFTERIWESLPWGSR